MAVDAYQSGRGGGDLNVLIRECVNVLIRECVEAGVEELLRVVVI